MCVALLHNTMQSCRVLETAVSLQLSSFFLGGNLARTGQKLSTGEENLFVLFFYLFLSVRYALAFPHRSLKPDIRQRVFFLHVAAFFLSLYF